MVAATPLRPQRYHRRSPLVDRAITRLVGKALDNRQIAELLSGLSPASLRTLDREGWTIKRAEDLAGADRGCSAVPWNVRQVRYHRRRLGLKPISQGIRPAHAAQLKARRVRQTEARWAHLLPDAERKRPGLILRQCHLDVLKLLRDEGPKTRSQLYGGLGRKRLIGHKGQSALSYLVQTGLVDVLEEDGLTMFALSERATPPERWQDTSIDAKWG